MMLIEFMTCGLFTFLIRLLCVFHGQVRTLIPKVERLIHNNGAESELLVLSGTIAMFYQGKQYNIPVDIYVSEPYPEVPPRCYVRPTKDMEIKIGHRHVDREVSDWSWPPL